jgi:hypothetical protein
MNMSQRWNYHVVEIKPGFINWTGKTGAQIQAELNKQGALGWELVQVIHSSHALHPTQLIFKRPQ